MRTVNEHEYTTYPRRFDAYRWYKPLLVGLLFLIFDAILGLGLIELLTKAFFGASVSSSGYDDMDFFSAAGAFNNGATAAAVIPCLLFAALIVKDRPVSSYYSSMGGWRWKVFLKTLAAAFVFLGIPTIVLHLVHGRTGDIRFTIGGFILLTLLAPLQGVGEELLFRSYIMQTVSSWFRLPVIGIIVQMLIFTAIHPYNIVGRTEIAVSALIYALIVVFTKGLESASALHIINNMSEIYMVGIGFGSITAEANITDTAVNVLFKILFLIFIIYADRKLHWFDEVQYNDVEKFNTKEADRERNMIKISFEVQEIDYGKCIESLLPLLTEESRSKTEPTELDKMLVRLGDDTVPIVQKLLGFLDTDVRDQIIVWLLDDQQDMIISSANAAIKEMLGGDAVVIGALYALDQPGTKISLHAAKVKTDSKQLIESPALTGFVGGAAKLAFRIAKAETIEKEVIKLLSSDLIKPKLISILSDSLCKAGLHITLSDIVIGEDSGKEDIPHMTDPEKDAVKDKIIDAIVSWLRETIKP